MAKIGGFTYLIIGLIVLIGSYMIDRERLLLFLIAGGFLVFVGVVKIILGIGKKEKKAKGNQMPGQMPGQMQQAQAPRQGPSENIQLIRQQQTAKSGKCSRCGQELMYGDRFCSFCGTFVGQR